MPSELDKYPYLGSCAIGGKMVVVLFNAPNKGMIVQSEIEDDPQFAFATYSEFNETYFGRLEGEKCVRLSNDPSTLVQLNNPQHNS